MDSEGAISSLGARTGYPSSLVESKVCRLAQTQVKNREAQSHVLLIFVLVLS